MKETCKKLLKALLLVLLCACVTWCLYVHRRVILAALKGEPLPEPPANHPRHCLRKTK